MPQCSPQANSVYPLDEPLPELPDAPRYPCPFITEIDVTKYLAPLYRIGWGVTHLFGTESIPPATRLSKRITLTKPDALGALPDVFACVIGEENHHPDLTEDPPSTDIHVHTHSARAPTGRQNADDHKGFSQKRPGITLRDIRFAILVERRLRVCVRDGLLELQSPRVFPQPTDIDSVHGFRALQPSFRSSAHG